MFQTPGERFAALLSHRPDDISFAALDRAAGMSSIGFAKQLAGGTKAGPITAEAFAPVLATTTDYLLFGRGRAPGKERVQDAMRRAVERHARKVAAEERTRNVNTRSGKPRRSTARP